jgi:hypothetical protein
MTQGKRNNDKCQSMSTKGNGYQYHWGYNTTNITKYRDRDTGSSRDYVVQLGGKWW